MLRSILLLISSYILIDNIFNIIYFKSTTYRKRVEKIKLLNKPMIHDDDLMNKSFGERMIKPLAEKLIKTVALITPIQEESRKELEQKLSMAGITTNPQDYRAMNIIIIVCLGLFGYFNGRSNRKAVIISIIYGIFGALLGYALRKFSLEASVTNRKKLLQKQLPEVMDILSVSVVAGLSFDQALKYVVEKAEGPLIDEFFIVRREMNLGKSKSEALNRMIDRCNVKEVTSFLNSVLQAEELGISLQNVLNTQSQMIRKSHVQSIEEKAAKIPVKILIPMVIFIFPVIFIILLAPAVPDIMNSLGG